MEHFKMRADKSNLLTSGRSNTLRESETWEKVESKKWKDNNRAADDRLSRKSRKKKKKKQREGFPVGFLGPRGGRREGRGCAARKGPPGAGPFRPPPFSFLPLPSPRRGVAALEGFAILLNGTLTSSFVKKLKRHTPSLILVLSYTLFTLKGGEGKLKSDSSNLLA